MRSLIKVKPLIDFRITATWLIKVAANKKEVLVAKRKMMFAHAIDAQMWAREEFGIEPKIEVKRA